MQSWMALLLAGMLIGPVAGSSVAYADVPPVSAEIETIVDAAFGQWHSSLGVQQDCSSAVSIVYEQLDGRRGEYRTQAGIVVIDPTDSVAGMGAIVAHELSHHTFLACGAFADAEFTAAFYTAQDLPEGRDWFDYSTGWSATPAEHFAEAMAITISGSGEGGIAVGAETTAIISRWLAGAPIAPPADSYEPKPYAARTGAAPSVEMDDDSGQPTVAPLPATAAVAESAEVEESVPEMVTIDLLGETIEFHPTTASVVWLNGWAVIGPL